MKKRAFTLVELLIYMGLFSIMLIVLTDIFVSVFDVRRESEAASNTQLDGNYIVARFLYDIPRAQSITNPQVAGAQSPLLQMTINSEPHTYLLNNGVLQMINNQGTFRLNSEETTVSNLNFQRVGIGTGKDTIVLSYTVTSTQQRKKGPDVKNYKTTIKLRCETLTC